MQNTLNYLKSHNFRDISIRNKQYSFKSYLRHTAMEYSISHSLQTNFIQVLSELRFYFLWSFLKPIILSSLIYYSITLRDGQ